MCNWSAKKLLHSLAFGDDTHRNHLLFLALLGQVLDAVDEELVGADVGPAGLDHPAAQLHQLGVKRKKTKGERNKNDDFEYLDTNTASI